MVKTIIASIDGLVPERSCIMTWTLDGYLWSVFHIHYFHITVTNQAISLQQSPKMFSVEMKYWSRAWKND
jgi:hypothetical protein